MKKLFFVAGLMLIGNQMYAKPVSVETAKTAGFKYLAKRLGGEISNADQLKLAYTSKSADGAVNYYYVFNAGDAFVMVSADDDATAVFGYSDQTAFDANNIPTNAMAWFDNYKNQIQYIIDNNVPASAETQSDWAQLLEGNQLRTTAGTVVVPPLVTTRWNQNPYYNFMCPFDTDENATSVTGCVATTMAQIMKYWNWPATGNSSFSYASNWGVLSADFGATTYNWNGMPNAIASNNPDIGTLMLHCGIAVRMDYSATSSGAYVTEAQSPYTNCAEYAFEEYFKYDAGSLHGERRSSHNTSSWIAMLKDELDHGRPIVYSGFGSAGGHAWVADGYDDQDYLHINWGWGGSSDGYFKANAMNPPSLGTGGGSGGFNNNQSVIVGIQPPVMGTPDQYEDNNYKDKSYDYPVSFNGNNATIKISDANFHITNDMDFYKFFLPMGDNYKISTRIHDVVAAADGNSYTVDAKVANSKNGTSWTSYKDDVMDPVDINGGGYFYVRILPQVAGEMGTYALELNIERFPTGISDVNGNSSINVYPNPASNMLNVSLNGAKAEVAVMDMQGRVMQKASAENQQTLTIPVSNLAKGMYFVQVKTDKETVTRKVAIEK